MKSRNVIAVLYLFSLSLSAMAGGSLPEGIKLPLMIFDVDWSDQAVGYTPQRAVKAQLEDAARDPWLTLPWRTYTQLDFVTRDRTAIVYKDALGLHDQPMVFNAPDGRHPQWGPRMTFGIPGPIMVVGRQYRVSLDVSIDNVTRMGGVSLPGVGELKFCEDGSLLFGKTEVGRYQPATPLHVAFVIDVPNRQCTTQIDAGDPLTMQWTDPRAVLFSGLRLDGLLPGGFARAPGQLAFDNIKIQLEK